MGGYLITKYLLEIILAIQGDGLTELQLNN